MRPLLLALLLLVGCDIDRLRQDVHDLPTLSCIRARESDTAGGYQAVSPSGRYRGAYQWDPPTWDAHAAAAGVSAPDPLQAEWFEQDWVAFVAIARGGTGPWGGGCS